MPTRVGLLYAKFKWVGRILIAGASSFVAAGAYSEELGEIFNVIAVALFLPVPLIFAPAVFHAMYTRAPKQFYYLVCSIVLICVSIYLHNTTNSMWYVLSALVIACPALTVLAGFVYIECKHEFSDPTEPAED